MTYITNVPEGWTATAVDSSQLSPESTHDIFAFHGIIFWLWQAVDAYRLTKVAQYAYEDSTENESPLGLICSQIHIT
jgi:hypothetical protein